MNKCFITIDATLHETKDLIVLDIPLKYGDYQLSKHFPFFHKMIYKPLQKWLEISTMKKKP